MIKRIIFDIDGTLITGVNFSSFITESLSQIGVDDLEKTRIFIQNIKEYEKKYNCYDRDLYLEFFSEKLNVSLDNKFLELFFEVLKNAVPENSEKIKEVLSELNDFELVLLSNFFEESQRNRLKTMDINDYFSEYYGEKVTKPNLQVYRDVVGKYNPNECVIIGDDRLLDIDIPSSLGFHTVYVHKEGDIKSVEELSPRLIKKL